MKIKNNVLSLSLLISLVASCGNDSSPPNDYTAFNNPELVSLSGYSGDAMEPFISRDGNYLFFNDSLSNKDLYYASRGADDKTYQTPVPILDINSPAVDGVPTMDDTNIFYFVSLYNYNGSTQLNTLYKGTWNITTKTVEGRAPLNGLTLEWPLLYFDIEVSPDNSTLYLSVGAFSVGVDIPIAADILIAVGSGGNFTLHPTSTTIMANVNTTDKLEYAPAISRNGLELFFTRLDPVTGEARIYRTVRPNTSSAFGSPQLVSNITGFVEGPAFSPDEKALYYHRHDPVSGKFEIYRVTRP